MSFTLKPLPFAMDALMPHIDKRTIEFHYTKHHQAYVNKLNDLIKETKFENESLEFIVRKASGPLFNNAAQVWNHTFYWEGLLPDGKPKPEGRLMNMIEKSFGSFDQFIEKFSNSAATLFGSGWTWLIQRSDGNLQIAQSNNAETPITMDLNPLLTCDVWEHAYYLDYQNKRPDYIKAFWNVVNWDAVEARMK
jgi:superoxide dismutase, Fe-Mn family